MTCPVCKDALLVDEPLEPDLAARVCNSCRGRWVAGPAYWAWLEKQGPKSPERPGGCPDDAPVVSARDSGPGKSCPECARFLTRVKVGHGIEFHLDRCPSCSGIWFDDQELEILKSRWLHNDVHFVFSAPWQAEVARRDREQQHEQLLRAKLGEQDLAEIKRIRVWIDQHRHRAELYAYLTEHLAEMRRGSTSTSASTTRGA
jgi:Zn-finger nucleic acid-binding protein